MLKYYFRSILKFHSMIKPLFCTGVFLLLSIFCNAQEYDPFFAEKLAKQEQQRFQLKPGFSESENYASNDLVYQRMEFEINPNYRYIKGTVTSYFKSTTQGLTEIEFDLHSALSVDSIFQNKRKIDFLHANNKLILPLQHPMEIGQLDSVQIFYQGEPPTDTEGFGSFEKSQHSGVPIIWTLSEPYGALEWFPCKQSLVDKIDSIDVIVSSPDSFRTASNGILLSETIENGMRKMHWKHRFPIATYLVGIAVTNYASYSDSLWLGDGRVIEILNYVYPENLETAKTQTPITLEIMALYNRLIGKYPFAREKYGHAQFGWGGGMEHQTMSFMSSFSFDLIAHELAHQWFGDYITLGSWQDIWLNEGFATYLTGLAYENLLDGLWWPIWKQATVNQIVTQPGGSVFVRDTANIETLFNSRLSYSKGAYLLHQLRWVLGDDDFFKGMRNYFNDPQVANGFARTDQFVKHMEMAGDTSLTEYFADWYYGEGYPIYSVEFAPVGTEKLKIILSQSTSHPSVSFFEMPVPVRVYNASKTDSADFRLVHTTSQQEFFVDVEFPVGELKIDPDLWLISKTDKVVAAQERLVSDKFVVYPNPFSQHISLSVVNSEQLLTVQLLNSGGILLKNLPTDERVFNLSHLPAGFYFLRIETSEGWSVKELVKQ